MRSNWVRQNLPGIKPNQVIDTARVDKQRVARLENEVTPFFAWSTWIEQNTPFGWLLGGIDLDKI